MDMKKLLVYEYLALRKEVEKEEVRELSSLRVEI